ncbi:hypothetical protein P170DRAFT_478805 [Aspergillus steynii IBT 23096]|uniref:LysR family regulatory protein n=1 Tax=Aspergillus steynii IBT 23096 TaxID=1392250 RepID=A0A2I2FZ05_9EURO|nr:uncharacterized protein P170DRAFT_478805 [Aspergillus steynii IBT 23096]PLB45872.1 hypothetical protein P170DRAFT_478805 [Aspergillus steynii IBT 23096]
MKPPKPVLTDTVIPLHLRDNALIYRNFIADVTFIFDDVLDADLVRNSLEDLIAFGEWRKLGARLRLRDDNGLEYHIPQRFDAKRPGVTFNISDYNMRMHEHPIASKVPRASNKLQLFSSPDEFDGLLRQPNTPCRLEDWIYSDRPQLEVYMIRFEDATLIRMTSLHTLMDAVGRSGLLQAWTAKLRGRDDQIPAFHGFSEDPMASYTTDALPRRPGNSQNGNPFLGWLREPIRLATALFSSFWAPVLETRFLCVPGHYLDSMRELARKQLEGGTNDEDKEPQFVSEGDVLLAWWIRTWVSAINPPPSKTITIVNMFNFRPALPELFPKGAMFLGNTIMTIGTRVPVGEMLQKPLGYLARRIRESIMSQSTRDHVELQAAIQARGIQDMGVREPFQEPDPLVLACTNRHKARYFDVDFSAAVSKEGAPKAHRSSAPGKPFFVLSRNFWLGSNRPSNSVNIAGKGPDDCWWISQTLPRNAWGGIERQLADANCNESIP